jgi:hypothetical protein
MDNVSELLSGAIAADPTRPQLTYYDDATGERTELSGATLANWVAKTANLLVDGLGLGQGDRALVLLPPHWQTAAVLLGCWSAGLSVVLTCPPDGGTEPVAEVAFVAAGRADEVAVGDRYAGVRVRDQGALCADAERRAAELGIGAGDRVLVDAASHPDPVDWLLAPLAAKATTVLCGHVDPDRVAARVATERVTRVI